MTRLQSAEGVKCEHCNVPIADDDRARYHHGWYHDACWEPAFADDAGLCIATMTSEGKDDP